MFVFLISCTLALLLQQGLFFCSGFLYFIVSQLQQGLPREARVPDKRTFHTYE